jgi:hypothetical protein
VAERELEGSLACRVQDPTVSSPVTMAQAGRSDAMQD